MIVFKYLFEYNIRFFGKSRKKVRYSVNASVATITLPLILFNNILFGLVSCPVSTLELLRVP